MIPTSTLFSAGTVTFGLIVLLLIWALLIYNRLVRLRQLVTNSWSNVESELQRRYDLIPRIVEVVRGYAAHERAVLEAVVESRTAAISVNGQDPVIQEPAEQTLITHLRGLLAVAEDYPDLKASANFLHLQGELTSTEDRIQRARRIYNANVRDNNILVESIPSRFVASVGGFERASFFEIDPAAEGPVEVSFE